MVTLEGTNGDLATTAIAVNAIPRVCRAAPGLVTMRDLPPLATSRGGTMASTIHIVDIGTVFGVRPSSELDLAPETLLHMMAQNQVDEARFVS